MSTSTVPSSPCTCRSSTATASTPNPTCGCTTSWPETLPGVSGFEHWGLRSPSSELAARYRAEGFWTDESLGSLLAGRLDESSSLGFVVHSRIRPWSGTFGDVLAIARRVATGLTERGVRPGDVVA